MLKRVTVKMSKSLNKGKVLKMGKLDLDMTIGRTKPVLA